MTDPIIGIIHARDQHPAAKSLEELTSTDNTFCDAHLPLSEALTREWEQDSHLILYRVDADQTGTEHAFARVSKRSPFVPELISKGGRITVPILVFDHDRHDADGDKLPWSAEALEEFVQVLGEIFGDSNLEPTYWYTTKHGSRFVYVLTEPVDHLTAEALARGIIRDFGELGIELDDSCTDWTRLFRLPKTVREDTGLPFQESEHFMFLEGGPALDPSTIEPGEASQQDQFGAVSIYSGEMPDPDEAHDLLVKEGKNGRRYDSDWVKAARTFLQGRDAFGVCFEHTPIDVSGGWNNGVTKLVGQVVGMTARLDEASPEGIYALLFPAIEQLQAEEDRGARETDWFRTTWDLICRMWSNEQAQIEAENAERAKKAAEAAELRSELLDQLKTAQPDEVPEDEEEAERWFRQRMIASDGRRHHVMRADGSYNIRPVSDSMLVPMIRDLGMEDAIPTMELRGRAYVPRSAQSILNDCATPITALECSARLDVAHIEGSSGMKKLWIPVHRLNPKVVARFDPRVDEWLQLLGGPMYERLVEWLSHALNAKRAICALNLYGAPGTGKGMLAAGLAECFEGEQKNDGRALGKFNIGLLDSPVVNCDEGVPNLKSDESLTVDQAFRSLVTGGRVTIRAMYQNPFNAEIYPRILFTSNDRDIIRSIVGHRDLTDDDIQAIEKRLLSIEVTDAAMRMLTSRGNYSYTAGWVSGAKQSDYIVAGHIRYLNEVAPPAQRGGNRLLVEGDVQTGLVRGMRLRSRSAQAVLRALVKMVGTPQGKRGLHVHDGRLWVTPAGVVEFMEQQLPSSISDVSLPKAGMVLRQFSADDLDGRKVEQSNPPGTKREQRGRWIEVDLGILYEEGLRYGMDVGRVEKLLRQHPDGANKIVAAEAHLPKDD